MEWRPRDAQRQKKRPKHMQRDKVVKTCGIKWLSLALLDTPLISSGHLKAQDSGDGETMNYVNLKSIKHESIQSINYILSLCFPQLER